MSGRLAQLPAETLPALQFLACLGHVAAVRSLSIALEPSEEHLHARPWPGVRDWLVERDSNSYRFIHDRVQEAAYSRLPEALRARTHFRIGRLLAANMPVEQREEAALEIVNPLDRGIGSITSDQERERLEHGVLRENAPTDRR